MANEFDIFGKRISNFQAKSGFAPIGFWRGKVTNATESFVTVAVARLGGRSFKCEQLERALIVGENVLISSYEGRGDMMEVIRRVSPFIATSTTAPPSGGAGVQIPGGSASGPNPSTPTTPSTTPASGNTGVQIPGSSQSGPNPSANPTTQPANPGLWIPPAGWTEVVRKDFTANADLSNIGPYGDYPSTQGAGTWLKKNVDIMTDTDGVRHLATRGYVSQDGKFVGGAFGWYDKLQYQLGGRWEWDGLMEDGGNSFAGVPFMLWPDDDQWPINGEIDVVERGGGSPFGFGSNYHLDVVKNSNRFIGFQFPKIDGSKRHVWAIEWIPGVKLETFCDGASVAKTTDLSYVPHTAPMNFVSQFDWIGQDASKATKLGPVFIKTFRLRYLKKAS